MTDINPIYGNNYFKLELNHEITNELLIKTHEIINKNQNNSTKLKELTTLIKKTNNIMVFDILLKSMPYNKWIEMFNECDILINYWNEELVNKIIDKSIHRLKINKLNSVNPEENELIILNESLNMKYNFMNNILEKRLNEIKDILNNIFFEKIDLNNFYGDENLLLLLGYNKFYKKNKLQLNEFIITLFCKNQGQTILKKDIDCYKNNSFMVLKKDNLVN